MPCFSLTERLFDLVNLKRILADITVIPVLLASAPVPCSRSTPPTPVPSPSIQTPHIRSSDDSGIRSDALPHQLAPRARHRPPATARDARRDTRASPDRTDRRSPPA